MSELKLGRGISDLIEENEIDVNLSEEVLDVEISLIKPNPEQPRTVFNPEKLKELCESIKEHGVIQPVILKPAANGYILVAGERRVKACELAGMTTVPSIIREYNAIYLSELAILENLQREDLTSIEEAIAFNEFTRANYIAFARQMSQYTRRVYSDDLIAAIRADAEASARRQNRPSQFRKKRIAPRCQRPSCLQRRHLLGLQSAAGAQRCWGTS